MILSSQIIASNLIKDTKENGCQPETPKNI
jgi:hypothetical protein